MNNNFNSIENFISNMFEKEKSLFTRNGTTAIWLLLKALGIRKKEIIVPSNICFVANSAIILSDNFVHLIDIDQDFSIDPIEIEKCDPKNIAGIIFPHMYGNIGSIKHVVNIAKKNNWFVIEDVCQALGSKKGDNYAGSFSDFAVTSFGTGKIVDMGIGGALSTNSESVFKDAFENYNKLKILNEDINSAALRFGKIYSIFMESIESGDDLYRFGEPLIRTYKDVFINKINPTSFPIDELEYKLKNLNSILEMRSKNAALFQEILNHENIQVLRHKEESTYWRQNILVYKKRDKLLKFLQSNGIKASKYFPSINKLFHPDKIGSFANSKRMEKQIINLWPGKETTRKDIYKINEIIRKFYKKN